MAYGIKYYANHKDDNNAITYKIEILLDGYAGAQTEIVNLGIDPVTISHRGSKDDKDAIIQGSELTFNFWHYKQSNVYDALFESNYKDYKVIYYKSASKIWEGYIKPENLTRQFLGDKYQISLSATDGLADLKSIEYPIIEGSVSILEAIKNCTDQLGISLDFKVQLNTYESALMTYNDCALNDIEINQKRFIKYEDGRAYNDTCYNVLSELLKPFSVTLKQDEGFYKITNYNEPNSYVYTFTYSTLAQVSRTSSNLIKDITSYDFLSKGELTKIEPIKRIDLTFQNRNLGENILPATWTPTGWNSVNYSGEKLVHSLYATTVSGDQFMYGESGSFYVEKRGDSDVLRISFNHRRASLTPSVKDAIYLVIQYQNPSSGTWHDLSGNLPLVVTGYNYTGDIPIDATGNYILRTKIFVENGTTSLQIDLGNFIGETIYESEDITFDKFIQGTNTPSSAIQTDERKVFFGDSFQDNDLGCLKVGATKTATWNRYGETDGVSLLTLYIQNLLNNNASYRDYPRLSIRDENDEINYDDVIKIGTKNYLFTYFQKSYKTNSIQCELIELLTADVTTNFSSQFLTSVDGKSSSTVVSSGSGVTDHGALTGLLDNDHTQYLRKDQADTTAYALTAASFKLGSWEIKLNGTTLEFHYSGSMKMKLSNAGYLVTIDEQEAFGS